jgi:DNA invertase Pin-like site-specific DNA recombinase
MPMKLRDPSTMLVACYARFSTDRQDARSIDDQLRRCRDYAQGRGHQIVLEERDAAISGAHIDRDGLQRLLALATRRPPTFQAVLVDDLSRLSRDLGATWRIVFEDLAAAGVKVIDCALGIASDDPNARLVFGATALVNDTFLQIVRHETHRGLQGRALAGFSTGGRTYGYTTVEEENAPDPEHKRWRPVIHEEEAALVRRVFDLFLSGWSLKRIASQLNHEAVPAPHDAGRGNKIGHGWGHSTVRAMLKNERYTGRWTWNQSKWVRVPGKRSRRRLARPEHEAVVREEPSLVIVPVET